MRPFLEEAVATRHYVESHVPKTGTPILHRFWLEVRHGREVVVKEKVHPESGYGMGRDWWPLYTNAGMARLAEEQVPLDLLLP